MRPAVRSSRRARSPSAAACPTTATTTPCRASWRTSFAGSAAKSGERFRSGVDRRLRRCHTNLDRRGAGFGRPADLRPRWRLATSGTLRLLGREACGGRCHGALGLRSGRWPNNRADEENQLRRIPLPARDYSPGDLALSPVHAQFSRRQRFAGRARIGGVLRDGSALVNHFGPMIAADLRKRRQRPHTTWHLDEVYLKIDGRMVYLWRAVDAEGEVLDVLVQS